MFYKACILNLSPHLVVIALIAELALRSQKVAISFASQQDLYFLLSCRDAGRFLAESNSELVGLSVIQWVSVRIDCA